MDKANVSDAQKAKHGAQIIFLKIHHLGRAFGVDTAPCSENHEFFTLDQPFGTVGAVLEGQAGAGNMVGAMAGEGEARAVFERVQQAVCRVGVVPRGDGPLVMRRMAQAAAADCTGWRGGRALRAKLQCP